MTDYNDREFSVWRTAYENAMRCGHSTETARSHGEAALEAFRAAFPDRFAHDFHMPVPTSTDDAPATRSVRKSK